MAGPGSRRTSSAAIDRLNAAISRHAGEYTDVHVRYPYGWHLQDQSNRKGTEVYVVGTTGDVAAARRELERVFPAEHLCVTRRRVEQVGHARPRSTALRTAAARAAGIGMPFPDVIHDRVTTELLVLDEAASRFLAGVAGGRVVPGRCCRRSAEAQTSMTVGTIIGRRR